MKARIGSIESPSQVVPALKLALSLKLARRMLLSSLAGALERIGGSDRSYGTDKTNLVPETLAGTPEAAQLVPALRSYIVRHVSGPRCTDNIPAVGQPEKSAAQFNTLVAKLDPTAAQYRPIPVEVAHPSTDEGTYQRKLLWQSGKSKEILRTVQWLSHGNRSGPDGLIRWTVQERSTLEWKQRYQDAVKLVGEWKADDENSSEEWFCIVADTYRALVDLVLPGPEREDSMRRYLKLLEEWYPTIPNHNLWFTQARQMLYTARFSTDPGEKSWILGALAQSPSPILAFYAKLESLVGPPQ